MKINHRSIFFKSQFGTLSITFRPGTPLFLFIHGLGGCRNHFDDSFVSVYGKCYGILTVDLLGFGDSDHFEKLPKMMLSAQIEALSELMIEMGINEITLVLHSLASALLPAILTCKKWPNLTKLVLIEADLLTSHASWGKKLALMDDITFDNYITRFKLNSTQVMRLQLKGIHSQLQTKAWSNCFQTLDVKALQSMAKDCSRIIQQGRIQVFVNQLTIPIEYIYGSESDVATNILEMTTIFHFLFSPILKAGHYPMLDNPEETYMRIFSNIL